MSATELQTAELAILHCRKQINRIQAELERRRRGGHDIRDAYRLLMTIQQILREHEAHRNRVAAASPVWRRVAN
jgi:hypothetical protein